jgi:hypothetical protein
MVAVLHIEAERERVLRDIQEHWPYADGLWLTRALNIIYGGGLDPRASEQDELDLRDLAITDLNVARQYLIEHDLLVPGRHVPRPRYDLIKDDHGLIDSNVIIRAYHPTRGWGLANRAALGEVLPNDAASSSRVRQLLHARPLYVDHITGIRRWLDTNPGSMLRQDYNNFVREHNADSPKRLVKASTLANTYNATTWSTLLEWARQGLTSKQARERNAEHAIDRIDGEFLSIGDIAAHQQISRSYCTQLVQGADFPAWAFTLSGARVWRLCDIDDHFADRPYPKQTPGWMQDQILGTTAIGQEIGMSPESIRTAYNRRYKTIPYPCGHAGRKLYWWRPAVEQWKHDAPNVGYNRATQYARSR